MENDYKEYKFYVSGLSNQSKGEIEYLFYDNLYVISYSWENGELLIEVNEDSEHYEKVEWEIYTSHINRVIRKDKASINAVANLEDNQGKEIVALPRKTIYKKEVTSKEKTRRSRQRENFDKGKKDEKKFYEEFLRWNC